MPLASAIGQGLDSSMQSDFRFAVEKELEPMSNYQITRTRKDGPDADRRIDAVEVENQMYSTDQIITWIENGAHSFYTMYFDRYATVYVRKQGATKYLTTSADGYGQNNLLLLPDF